MSEDSGEMRARDRGRLGLLLLALVAFFALTYSFRPISDTRLNSVQTRALALHGDVDLTRYGALKGFTVDERGKRLSVYGIGVSLTGLPQYVVLARTGARESLLQASVGVPFAAAAVLAMFLLLRALFDRSLAVWGTVVFGFGTTMWPVASMAFWQQAPVALLMTIGIGAMLRAPTGGARHAPLIAGAALGAATFVRPSAVIFCAVVALYYLAFERRALGWFVAGGLPFALAMLVQNRVIWGSFGRFGYGEAGVGFNGDASTAMWAQLFGWWRGLFVYSPVLLLGVAGIVLALRQRDALERRLSFVGLGVLGSMVFYAKWLTWWGGTNQFGPRYLLDAVPGLTILSVYALRRVPSLRTIGIPLTVVSVLTMAVGSRANMLAWDAREFAPTFESSPIGQAWIDGIDHPVSVLARVVGIGALAAIMWWAAERARPPVRT